MKLISKLRKQQTGQIGVEETNTPAETLFGDLTPLSKLIAPIRKYMAEYDHAIHALAVARERLRDLADAPPLDMSLTVKREIAVAMNDPEELSRFDAEYGAAIKAEREAREAAVRDREELPARILALEQVVRQIANKMIDNDCTGEIERAAEAVFKPYAQRLFEAAKQYANLMQQATTAAWILNNRLAVHEYDLFGDKKRIHRPELIGDVEDGILPVTMAGVSWEEIQAINLSIGRTDEELASRMGKELVEAGLGGERLRMYYPCAEDSPYKVYAPELTQCIKRPQLIPNAASTIVRAGL